VTRRQLLALAGVPIITGPARGSEAQNLSFPLSEIEGDVTAPNLFFVRDHFSEPELSLEAWTLRIEGCVSRPYELSFSDLIELPTRKVQAVLECAGNVANGSAVSNGIWEGVSISSLLAPAGVAPEAVSVALEGADTGRLFPDSPLLPYSQLVPLEKCRESSSMVAFKLNGLLLPRRNGFPARALLPGWYAMDSVKWLQRIVVLGCGKEDSAFHQSGMDRVYNRLHRLDDGTTRTVRLSSIQVKSAIAWPAEGIKLPAGRHVIRGFAWSGGHPIRDVALTTDDGKSWRSAKLESAPGPFQWVRWTYAWTASPGDYVLMSRASDTGGNTQPVQRDRGRKDYYEANWCPQLHCGVR
jgi:DMSO/TMAO reductase YedYZ molybdopterin-dependent catalytic subunit